MHKEGSIVVVGAGVFGLSTALELKRPGYGDITVLDRHLPPVPDGSSVDISRIVNQIMQMSSMLEWALKPLSGYCNLDAGWADTAGCIKHLASICEKANVNFLSGERADGEITTANTVVLATGAWTPHLIGAGNRFLPTGQPVGYMKLAPEEAAEMQGGPVMIYLSTGWFAFPPTDDRTLKMARHGYGFETTHTPDSTRYSAPSVASQSDCLPADAEQALRDGLALSLPRFRDRP
ncbi:hypothetical protein E4T43_04203 [Aureobasidium subglaciale]|nr:hypothetical protein E4T43_04203 [Aureobasidium subglaciale]